MVSYNKRLWSVLITILVSFNLVISPGFFDTANASATTGLEKSKLAPPLTLGRQANGKAASAIKQVTQPSPLKDGQWTLSDIKADVGGFPGHVGVHPALIEVAKAKLTEAKEAGLIHDFEVTTAGDDLHLVMTHRRGEDDPEIHKLAWDTFKAGADKAKELKLYGAGQDLLVDSFSGNVRGMGPGVAEMTFTERKSEPVIIFRADKTAPSVFNMLLFKMFADPFNTAGLIIDPAMSQGFKFEIWDIKENKRIFMNTLTEYYDILALISSPRYVVKRVFPNPGGKLPADEPVAVASAERLSYIAGEYVGKDDPVMIVRSQSGLPAVGEIIEAVANPQIHTGWMRGSHHGPVLVTSVEEGTPTRFDGPIIMVSTGHQLANGMLQEAHDMLKHVSLDRARARALEQADYWRTHGPFEPHRLPPEEMEYTNLRKIQKELARRWESLGEPSAEAPSEVVREVVEAEETPYQGTHGTVAVYSAGVGGWAGKRQVHPDLINVAEEVLRRAKGAGRIIDFQVRGVGDDLRLVITHNGSRDSSEIYQLALDAFTKASEKANELKLSNPGQDLKGAKPSINIAALEFDERKSETIIPIYTDKTQIGSLNIILFKMFADPFTSPSLVHNPKLHEGFAFEIWDAKENKLAVFRTHGELYQLLAFIGARDRYIVRAVYPVKDGQIQKDNPVAVVSTQKVTIGNDDIVALVRAEEDLPGIEELIEPFRGAYMTAGFTGALLQRPLSPVGTNSAVASRTPIVVAEAYQINKFQLGSPNDLLDDTTFDSARTLAMKMTDELVRGPGIGEPHTRAADAIETSQLAQMREALHERFVAIGAAKAIATGEGNLARGIKLIQGALELLEKDTAYIFDIPEILARQTELVRLDKIKHADPSTFRREVRGLVDLGILEVVSPASGNKTAKYQFTEKARTKLDDLVAMDVFKRASLTKPLTAEEIAPLLDVVRVIHLTEKSPQNSQLVFFDLRVLVDEQGALVEGADVILNKLKEKGLKSYILTAEATQDTIKALRDAGISEEMLGDDKVLGGVESKKEAIEATIAEEGAQPTQSVYIGVNVNDILQAKQAGVIAVAFLKELGLLNSVLNSGADYLVNGAQGPINWQAADLIRLGI